VWNAPSYRGDLNRTQQVMTWIAAVVAIVEKFLTAKKFSTRSERGIYQISVRSMNIDDRPTDDRPTTNDRPQGPFTHFGKISNGHNSVTRQPIPFMFVLGWGFRGRRIERRHFRLDQIQDGGRRPSWKTSNSHISATYYSIHCRPMTIQTILCPRSLIYNDGDSKLVS